MAQNKYKSIHDNISLEGLDAVFDIQALKESELEVLEQNPLSRFSDIVSDTICQKLKLKNNRKALEKFLTGLPKEIQAKDCTVFQNTTKKKSKDKKRLEVRETISLILVHEPKETSIAYLEDHKNAVIDVIPESNAPLAYDNNQKQLEDELISAYCKVDILKSKQLQLHQKIDTLESQLHSQDQELIWLKSQQDMLAHQLNKVKKSWIWKLRNWFLKED